MAKINQGTIDKMFILLASWGVFRQKTHSYHWNIKGQNFNPLHKFFGDLYDTSVSNMDAVAERLRQLGVLVPLTLSFCVEKSVIEDKNDATSDKEIVSDLIEAVAQLSILQTEIYIEAEDQKDSVTLDLMVQLNKGTEQNSWWLSALNDKENDSKA